MKTYDIRDIEQLSDEVADMDALSAIDSITTFLDWKEGVENNDRINWCDRYNDALRHGYDQKGAVGIANDYVTVCYDL